MKAYVPKEKRSKKQQKLDNQLQRATWPCDPSSRRIQSAKAYRRHDKHRRIEHTGGFFMRRSQPCAHVI